MKQTFFEIKENTALTSNVFKMTLAGDTEGIAAGQFVNIKLEGLFLRRPISVCDSEDGVLTLIYKVVGKGTAAMSLMNRGDVLNILTGLGNGYNKEKSGSSPLLIGGGVGIPPLYKLAKELIAEGKSVKVILGFNTADEVFYEKEFAQLGASVTVTTVDGSYGREGFVTDAMKFMKYTYFYACGPEPMLKAVYRTSETDGEMSFEERMGCGFGACMGCSCKTVTGNKRICKEGPVITKEDIIWEA